MKKLRLDLDGLSVVSFSAHALVPGKGTVEAREAISEMGTCQVTCQTWCSWTNGHGPCKSVCGATC